jgi:phosphatidylserine/phosphatidylglycerophosphate/cardiolipin synthase-like enzyme
LWLPGCDLVPSRGGDTVIVADREDAMRMRKSAGGLSAMAIAGTHVVLLGWSMERDALRAARVLGFGIRRHRHADGEVIWLSGLKTFASVDALPDPGIPVSSFRHPFQTFQWADYSAAPGMTYTYRLVAMTGAPGALAEGPALELTVTTESGSTGEHAVFFNRGAIASQEYARRFQNRDPEAVGQPALDWLSRGLVEGLEAFIGGAGRGEALHGAFYEFEHPRIHAALRAARKRGAEIRILYDGRTQRADNESALEHSGILRQVAPREHPGQFAHNKFLVFSQRGRPRQVWTGSTNLTLNGLFGHSNNAHVVREPTVAKAYRDYWDILAADETRAPTATAVEALNALPDGDFPPGTTAVFSPRRSLDALDRYAAMAAGAGRALFATFAFGMNERFVRAYDRRDPVLRFALMEKKGNGATLAEQSAEIERIRKHPNVTISVGNFVRLNAFDRWLQETDTAIKGAHVLYVHTKYMLVDPLGEDPLVVVGSANFSAASTDKNDENMLVIRGEPAVADIYLGEFMRLFTHYAFRESLGFRRRPADQAALPVRHLAETAGWIDGAGRGRGYFSPGTDRMLRRLYFSGQ